MEPEEKSKIKTVLIRTGLVLGVIFGFVILLTIVLAVFDSQDPGVTEHKKTTESVIENTKDPEKEKNKNELEPFDIEIKDDYIIGKIKNTTNYKIDYIEINFEFLDKDKVIIEDSMTNKLDFLSGDTWQFKVYIIDNKYDTYRYNVKYDSY